MNENSWYVCRMRLMILSVRSSDDCATGSTVRVKHDYMRLAQDGEPVIVCHVWRMPAIYVDWYRWRGVSYQFLVLLTFSHVPLSSICHLFPPQYVLFSSSTICIMILVIRSGRD